MAIIGGPDPPVRPGGRRAVGFAVPDDDDSVGVRAGADDDFSYDPPPASDIAAAFHGARDEDSTSLRDARSSSGPPSLRLYAVPRRWMDGLLSFVRSASVAHAGGSENGGAARPGIIENADLLEGGATAGSGGSGGGGAASSASSASAVSAPDSGLLPDSAGGGAWGAGDGDDGASERVRWDRRQRWMRRMSERPALRRGRRHGEDFVLVGETLWTILSSKFGCDVALPLPLVEMARDEDEDNMLSPTSGNRLAVQLYPADPVAGSGPVLLETPLSGRWDYGPLDVADEDDAGDGQDQEGDLVPEDEVDSGLDDLFPDMDNETDSSLPPLPSDAEGGSPAPADEGAPVILLPPSTASATTAGSTGKQLAMVSLDENNDGDDSRGGGGSDGSGGNRIYPAAGDGGYDDDDDDDLYGDGAAAAADGEPEPQPASNKRKRCASGLGNLGNTCFMNSTLQCLAHTEPLRKYFIDGDYAKDLNRGNPLGTGGELATEFAQLLRQMWGIDCASKRSNGGGAYGRGGNGYYLSSYRDSGSAVVYPREFKYTLGRHAEQFMGYDQHDSQELATYLLDALHEDTNRVTKKPYVEKPEQGEDEPDDEAAEKAWGLHLRREDSRVLESFMGQVKSRVQCPRESCGRVSTTFDPFMYLSVPIPGATDRTMIVTYVPLDPGERMKKLSVALSKTSSVATLRRKIIDLLNGRGGSESFDENGAAQEREQSDPAQAKRPPGVLAEDLCLADVWNSEIYTFYSPDDEVDKIRDNDYTYAYQLRSVRSIHEEEGAEEGEEEEEEEDEADEGPAERRPKLRLDLATISRLNRDDAWQTELEGYLVQPMAVMTMTNPNRTTHEERMLFHKKLDRFAAMCRQCPDAVPPKKPPKRVAFQTDSDDDMSASGTASPPPSGEEKEDGRPVTDEDFDLSDGEKSAPTNASPDPADDGSASASASASADEDAPTLAERCETSTNFRSVETARDLAVFEFCVRKFRQFAMNLAREKKNKYKDGVVVQVILKRIARPSSTYSYSGVGIERSFGAPLAIRVSPRMTVYNLREELGRRLARVVRPEEGDDRHPSMSPKATRSPKRAEPETESEPDDKEMKVASDAGDDAKNNAGDMAAGNVERCNGNEVQQSASPALYVLRQVPMTYERKSVGGYNKSHQSYRKLGSLLKGNDSGVGPRAALSLASPSDEGEGDLVADLVGPHGTIQLHWPLPLAERLDEDEWGHVEDLPAPDAEDGDRKLGKRQKKQVDVLDCISKYCQVEQLEESEMWYCNQCKEHVRAWKQFHLYRAPPILIIHLKRFHYSATTHRRDKIDTFIDFPLGGLDLTREVTHWEEGQEPIYDCYAVSNHYGGLGGGHYTAYALNDDGVWCHFDDSRVTAGISEKEVKSAAAYVLYYKRRDVKGDVPSASLKDGEEEEGVPNITLNRLEDDDEEMDVDSAGAAAGSGGTCPSPMDSIDGEDGDISDDSEGGGGSSPQDSGRSNLMAEIAARGRRGGGSAGLEMEPAEHEENPQAQ